MALAREDGAGPGELMRQLEGSSSGGWGHEAGSTGARAD